ncbi:hypothetical protein ACHAWF_014187 [Thalassiosira exigua]
MKTEDPATDVEGQRHGSTQRVSFQNNATVIEEGGGEQSEDDDASSSSSEPIPLHHSCRVKGYLTLFVSALFNYMAANEQLNWTHGDKLTAHLNLCISSLSMNGNDVMGDPAQSPHRLRFSAAVSMITMTGTGMGTLGSSGCLGMALMGDIIWLPSYSLFFIVSLAPLGSSLLESFFATLTSAHQCGRTCGPSGLAKMAKNILRREEEKLAKLSQDTKKTQGDDDLSEEAEEDDDGVLCEDVQVDDDITISITSGFGGNHPTSSSARSGTGAVSDATTPTESMIVSATKSIFTSALSFIFSEEIDDDKGSPEADKSRGHQTDDKMSNKADEEL